MYLGVEGMAPSEFVRSTVWRSCMYFAADEAVDVDDEGIWFANGLGLNECREIVENVLEGDGKGAEVVIDQSFEDYVERAETYIHERSSVGTAIKSSDPKTIEDDPTLGEQFREFRNVVNDAMVRPLRDRQMYDAFFLATVGRAADFSVPGAGKTATVLGAFAYLRSKGKIRRIVVVCPKSGFEAWQEEWRRTFGAKTPLRCFCLGDSAVSSLPLEARKRSLELDTASCNLFLLNYESLHNYVGGLRDIVEDQTLLVFDEVHRVKRVKGKRASVALKVASNSKFTMALTGTPIPNTYMDIYNLLHILYPEDYDTFFGFEPEALEDADPRTATEVNRKLVPFFCRTSKDQLGVPAPEPDKAAVVKPTATERRLQEILNDACTNALALMVRTMQLESDPTLLECAIDKDDLEYVLDQVGDDFTDIDYVNFSEEWADLLESVGKSSKLKACEELVKDIVSEGRPVIVWCAFVRSIHNIVRDLNEMGITADAVYGAVPYEERVEILESFRAGGFQVLVTNPQTLAESVSLHDMCHDAVYFEYSYNLVHLLQSKDRIHRLGLAPDQKTRYYFMVQYSGAYFDYSSLDLAIYERLKEKENTMLAAIDGGWLERGYVDEEDLRVIFEKVLGNRANKLRYR